MLPLSEEDTRWYKVQQRAVGTTPEGLPVQMAITHRTTQNVLGERSFKVPLSLSRLDLAVPVTRESLGPVGFAEELGKAYLRVVEQDHRKKGGHYQTPAAIARFMASRVSYPESRIRVLDPGSGTGVLSAAVCEAVSDRDTVQSLHIDAYEMDPLLAEVTQLVLQFSCQWLLQRGIALTFHVRGEDFVLACSATRAFGWNPNGHMKEPLGPDTGYDLVISNPPYFKIRKRDPRAVAGGPAVYGQPNIYAMFMSVSAELLSEAGSLVYIVPRSFASGPYFMKFREVFFQRVLPTSIHLFESRKDVFKNQTVLQENLVIAARRRNQDRSFDDDRVVISHSRAAEDIDERQQLSVRLSSVLNLKSAHKELCIPVCAGDLQLAQTMRSWPNTLQSLGLEVSTGPVVPFRATQFLVQTATRDANKVPLLWMHHVRPMQVEWPRTGWNKPQWISSTLGSEKLLVKSETYVLIRRFSAKEEKRRIVAAPLGQSSLGTDMLGLENHLNYIRGEFRPLDMELATGLAALLNSSFLDRYFRLSNGNTQVSATELRVIPLPDERSIREIGGEVQDLFVSGKDISQLDVLIARILSLPRTIG